MIRTIELNNGKTIPQIGVGTWTLKGNEAETNPDVTLYEMQGFDHGAMPHPAYHVMKQHIKRLCQLSK